LTTADQPVLQHAGALTVGEVGALPHPEAPEPTMLRAGLTPAHEAILRLPHFAPQAELEAIAYVPEHCAALDGGRSKR